jgi:hypothetical protein
VLRSELQLEEAYALTRLSTSFRWDERFGINPTATYSTFRSFSVKSEETIDLPR